MNYRDLNIHQRITAKGNALAFNFHYRITNDVLARVVRRDPAIFDPTIPFYAIQFKTNTFDLKRNQQFA